MAKFIDPIYDRTSTDIANKTTKAYFNIVDWVRVYGNVKILHDLIEMLLRIDIDFTDIEIPTAFTIPTAVQVNTLVGNIENIRKNCGLPAALGIVELFSSWTSGMPGQSPNFEDVNDWERNLYLIFDNIAKSVDFTVYCGVASCGQPRIYQHRWHHFSWVKDSETPIRTPIAGVTICGADMTRQNLFRRYD